jgi:hypothetical protein
MWIRWIRIRIRIRIRNTAFLYIFTLTFYTFSHTERPWFGSEGCHLLRQ